MARRGRGRNPGRDLAHVPPTEGAIHAARFEMSASYEGPLPPPQMLEQYGEIIPNGADRLMTLLEHQSDHRMWLEKNALKLEGVRMVLGIVAAAAVTLGTLYVAYSLIVAGQGIAGLAGAITALAVLAGVFVYGERSRRSEREKRMALLTGQHR